MANNNNNNPPVTSASRKDLIWAAFQEKETELDELRAATATAEDAKAEARLINLEDEHGEFNTEKVIEITSKLKMSLASEMSRVSDELEQSVSRLNSVNEHIEIKESELKQLFDIERSANTLDALAKTQQEQKAAFATEQRQTKEGWDLQKQERNTKWQREQDEHAYNFQRTVKEKTDEFKDTLAEQKKKIDGECETRLAAVATKEAEQTEAINNAAALETQMAEMEVSHAEALTQASEEASTRAKQSYGFESRALKSDFEAKITVLQGTNSSLQEQLDRANKENSNLQNQLSAANTKIQEVAMASLQSDAQKQAFNAMADNVAGKNEKAGKR